MPDQKTSVCGTTPDATLPYDDFMQHIRIKAVDLVDVLVYLTVLGIFAQLFPKILSESFLTSLVTAVLLKVVLEFVVRIKKRIVSRIRNANKPRVRVVSSIGLVMVAAGGKALILWITDAILGDAVYLGGFFAVTLLVVTLMLARAGVRRLIG